MWFASNYVKLGWKYLISVAKVEKSCIELIEYKVRRDGEIDLVCGGWLVETDRSILE